MPGSQTSPAPEDWDSSLMFRAFDFTAAPGRTYRYRARVVLFNPAFPKTKRGSKFVFGPWSEPTAAVTIP